MACAGFVSVPIVFNERCVSLSHALPIWHMHHHPFLHYDAWLQQAEGSAAPNHRSIWDCRVEMTVSRGVLRIVGTVTGGTIGFLIMLHHSVAADPYALMASPASHHFFTVHS